MQKVHARYRLIRWSSQFSCVMIRASSKLCPFSSQGYNITCIPSLLTTVWLFVGDVTAAVGIDPSHHVHVVGHERGNLTLENGRIAAYRELIVNLNLKVLGDHCNGARKKQKLDVCPSCASVSARRCALIAPIKISMNLDVAKLTAATQFPQLCFYQTQQILMHFWQLIRLIRLNLIAIQ